MTIAYARYLSVNKKCHIDLFISLIDTSELDKLITMRVAVKKMSIEWKE